jgi:hypothetical protein
MDDRALRTGTISDETSGNSESAPVSITGNSSQLIWRGHISMAILLNKSTPAGATVMAGLNMMLSFLACGLVDVSACDY